jgi:hypothetical protein
LTKPQRWFAKAITAGTRGCALNFYLNCRHKKSPLFGQPALWLFVVAKMGIIFGMCKDFCEKKFFKKLIFYIEQDMEEIFFGQA